MIARSTEPRRNRRRLRRSMVILPNGFTMANWCFVVFELVSAAHGDPASVLEAVTTAAQAGVLELDDVRIRFSHPLLPSIG